MRANGLNKKGFCEAYLTAKHINTAKVTQGSLSKGAGLHL